MAGSSQNGRAFGHSAISEVSEALPTSDTNGSHPDEVLAVIEAQFGALSLAAEGVGVSLYAVAVASKKKQHWQVATKLPEPVPLNTAMARDEVVAAAHDVEHAYSVPGGFSVPLSITLRRLQTAVRHLRALEYESPMGNVSQHPTE